MPHETTWEENGVVWRFSGTVTYDEVTQATNEMYGSPRFDDIFYFIWDGTKIGEFVLTEQHADMRAAIGKASSTYKSSLKAAFIATDDSISQLVERYIERSKGMGSPWDFELFDNEADARKWVEEE